MPLTRTQIRYLRGLAHPLKPVVLLGAKGVTAGVVRELDQALDDHELIKVRLAGVGRDARDAELAALTAASHAEPVQAIGKVAVLYRRNTDTPRIALPK